MASFWRLRGGTGSRPCAHVQELLQQRHSALKFGKTDRTVYLAQRYRNGTREQHHRQGRQQNAESESVERIISNAIIIKLPKKYTTE